MQRHLLMNVQFRSLGPLGRTRPLAAFRPRGLRRGYFENAGFDIRTGLLSFEKSDLVTQQLDGPFQLLDAILLDAQKAQQSLDQRGAFLGRDIGKLQFHTAECRKTRPDQLRQNPPLLSSYLISA